MNARLFFVIPFTSWQLPIYFCSFSVRPTDEFGRVCGLFPPWVNITGGQSEELASEAFCYMQLMLPSLTIAIRDSVFALHYVRRNEQVNGSMAFQSFSELKRAPSFEIVNCVPEIKCISTFKEILLSRYQTATQRL